MQAKAFDIRGRVSALVVFGALALPGAVMAQNVAQDIPEPYPVPADSASTIDVAYTPAGLKSVQTGVATYYARSFQGRRTASGERYDMHAMSAAPHLAARIVCASHEPEDATLGRRSGERSRAVREGPDHRSVLRRCHDARNSVQRQRAGDARTRRRAMRSLRRA